MRLTGLAFAGHPLSVSCAPVDLRSIRQGQYPLAVPWCAPCGFNPRLPLARHKFFIRFGHKAVARSVDTDDRTRGALGEQPLTAISVRP